MILPLIVALGIVGSPIAPLGQTNSSGRLAALLKDWEKAESQVKDVRKVIRRTYVDRVWRTEEVTRLVALGKKPHSFRVEENDATGKPKSLLVYGESLLGSFDYRTKTQIRFDPRIHSSKAPWETEITATQIFFMLQRFYLGFDVKQFAREYDLTLAGEDKFYAYLTVKPRESSHNGPKRSWFLFEFPFEIMQIALRKSDFQPREILWSEPGGNTTRLEFLEVKTNLNPPVTEQMIEADLPKGWDKTGAKQP